MRRAVAPSNFGSAYVGFVMSQGAISIGSSRSIDIVCVDGLHSCPLGMRRTAAWILDCFHDVQRMVLNSAARIDLTSSKMIVALEHKTFTHVSGSGTERSKVASDGCGRKRSRRDIIDDILDAVNAPPCLSSTAEAYDAASSGRVRLVGMCIAKEITEAFRTTHHEAPSVNVNKEKTSDCSPLHVGCEEDMKMWSASHTELSDQGIHGSSVCGVELIWVADDCRRLGIATTMVDCMRRVLVYGGHEIPPYAVAFSQPTREGKLFAAKFAGRKDFFTFIE